MANLTEKQKENLMKSFRDTMKRIHGNPFPDHLYIGVVKFYDPRKGFGYIASNNCGMKSSEYEQDFYVDSSSFKEESAKTDRRLVVFQWEVQDNGKRRAINVRNYSSKLEDDLELALTYYGDYEFVQLKDQRINMFNHLNVKRPQMLPLLKRQIEKSQRSSPKEICEKILHLIKKYKTELPEDKRYIITKDYDNVNRPLWEDIFSLLNRIEWIELLNTLPPVALYVKDSTIITEWIDDLSIDISDSIKLKDLEYSKRYIPKDLLPLLNARIEYAVNLHILSIIDENKSKTSLPTVGYGIIAHGITRMEQSIREYLPYTSRNFDTEIYDCKRQVTINRLKELANEYDPSKYDSNSTLDKIIEVFKSIDNRDQLRPILLPLIEQKITRLFGSKSFPELSKFLDKIRNDFTETVNNTLIEITSSVLEYLTESFDKCIESASPYEFERTFENNFSSVSSLINEDVIVSFKMKCRHKILSSTSVNLLSYASTSHYKWIGKDEATRRISDIISAWNFKNVSSYMSGLHGLENIPELIQIELANRTFQVIGNDIATPFDGTLKVEYDHFGSSPWKDNIKFLNDLKKLCVTDELKTQWENYVNNLPANDILSLYYKEVITSLPSNIVSKFVSELSLDDTYNKSDKWYTVPAFKDERKKRIFSDSGIDVFTAITQHLQNMTIEKENISLAVWLVELLSFNKPGDDDYYIKKEWENTFIAKIRHLKSLTENNHRLSVLLWAIYLQTSTNKAAMAEVFPWLPPYLQIKIVKRLFRYIYEGKMNFTAHDLYDFLTSSNENLCLPVEIVFSYLKLREDNPDATFTNTHMLSLIDDRQDHSEWIGIREFVEQCLGRWYANSNYNDNSSDWHSPLYNGILRKCQSSSDLELFVPRKMISGSDSSKVDNNKYYFLIKSIIGINFDKRTLTKKEYTNGTWYRFSENNKIPLLNFVRKYNIKVQWYDTMPTFACNPNEDDYFCECRLANALSRNERLPFYWCGNKPCFRPWVRLHTNEEWEDYTILDFMSILNIPTDYVNKEGKVTRFGYFIIFSGFLRSFARFYDHLKCRCCGKLMHPLNLSNFASRSITEFACNNDSCKMQGQKVYLNHCFNKPKCDAIIDSRDSKQCPNGQYICPECGGCCSTGNFSQRISNLSQVGGVISPWLENFVRRNLGHWENNERYCYKCGGKMIVSEKGFLCPECKVNYSFLEK